MNATPGPRSLVLVVDDDVGLCALLERWLEREGYESRLFHDGESCLQGLAHSLPDCICLDLNMPGLSGLETLERIKARHPHLPVIVLTAEEDVETVVTTMQAGAYDYLTKPINRTKLATTIRRAVEQHRLSVRLSSLEREVEGGGFHGIIGESPAMRQLFRQMDRLSASDITLLIHGESGTGKELVANAIHRQSSRRAASFVAVNCAAIPETLEESEFFGHEKGAFTGASGKREGRFEQAHQGTLFLDEVGELSLGLQAKLLRVLQERRFQRVGGSVELHSDFRLVAATHRHLEEEVGKGRFREDLFYRLAVFELEVPPLRERRGDVGLLARYFASEAARAAGKEALELSPETLEVMRAYSWPGNVRELQNAIERAGVVARGGKVEPGDLPRRIRRSPRSGTGNGSNGSESPAPERPAAPFEAGGAEPPAAAEPAPAPPPAAPPGPRPVRTLDQLEKEAILEALERTGGNLSEVVRQLGIGRTTLYRKLQRYGLR